MAMDQLASAGDYALFSSSIAGLAEVTSARMNAQIKDQYVEHSLLSSSSLAGNWGTTFAADGSTKVNRFLATGTDS